MNKAAIIAALSAALRPITPPTGNPELVEGLPEVNKYLFYHLAVGADVDGSPIAQKAFKVFYVWHEGQADEEALYDTTRIVNPVDNGVVNVTGRLEGIKKLYDSSSLRVRVKGAMIKSAENVFEEAPATANHAKRLLWAVSALSDITEKQLNLIMATVTSKGPAKDGTATDGNIQSYVDSNLEAWALAQF